MKAFMVPCGGGKIPKEEQNLERVSSQGWGFRPQWKRYSSIYWRVVKLLICLSKSWSTVTEQAGGSKSSKYNQEVNMLLLTCKEGLGGGSCRGGWLCYIELMGGKAEYTWALQRWWVWLDGVPDWFQTTCRFAYRGQSGSLCRGGRLWGTNFCVERVIEKVITKSRLKCHPRTMFCTHGWGSLDGLFSHSDSSQQPETAWELLLHAMSLEQPRLRNLTQGSL